MKRRNRLPIAPSLALLAAVLLAGRAPAEIVERVIAKVNGDVITLSEFETRQLAAVTAARVPPERVEAFLRENNSRILQDAIDEVLIAQRGVELGFKVRAEYLKEIIEGIKKENNIESDEALQRQLQREGMSLDDLKRNIERSIVKQQVMSSQVQAKAAVSEADARAEYEARKADYTVPAALHLQEIQIAATTPDAATLAQDVVRRARAGEDFAALARQYSSSHTREAGGDLGRLARADMSPDIAKIAVPLAAGAISDPAKTADGYRILRVAERTADTVRPFEEVKAEILKRLAQSRSAAAMTKYVEELRKGAILEVKVREVPLQVSAPAGGAVLNPSLAEPPAEAGTAPAAVKAPAPITGDTPEFVTTPQEKPKHVVPVPGPPPSPPGGPTPGPTPTPQP